MTDQGKRKYMNAGIIGTLLFHVMLVIMLLIYSFRTPLPLPEEEGVFVNLGYTDMGTGYDQPSRQPSASSSESSAGEEDVATQDTEDAPVMGGQDNHHQPDETVRSQLSSDPQPDPEPAADPSLAYSGPQSRGSGSQGETQQQGSQGDPQGDPDGQAGGQGQGGRGLDFSLSGRTGLSLPEPPKIFSEQGRVAVRIWVDREGKVIRAEQEMKGSTTTDAQLIRLAEEAAMKARFSKKNDAPEPQVGTITYIFTTGR